MNSTITLVTGGARSGKSSYAVDVAKVFSGEVVFVATAEARDPEMSKRIDKHKVERPAHWRTFEIPLHLAAGLSRALSARSLVVVDCVTLWVTNIMLSQGVALESINYEKAEHDVEQEIETLFDLIKSNHCSALFITNEVGMGLVPETALGRQFRDIAGRANQIIARKADSVVLMVSGIILKIK